MISAELSDVLATFVIASRLALGAVFTFSAVQKARAPKSFVDTVTGYQVVPRPLAWMTGIVLIATEAAVAVSLLTSWWLDVGATLALALLLTFLAAVSLNLTRNRRIPCGCFGSSNEEISGLTVVRLLMLVALAGVLMFVQVVDVRSSRAIDTERLVDAGALAAALLLGGTWVLRVPQLYALANTLALRSRSSVPTGTDHRREMT